MKFVKYMGCPEELFRDMKKQDLFLHQEEVYIEQKNFFRIKQNDLLMSKKVVYC